MTRLVQMDRRYVPDWVFLMLISIFGLGFIQLYTSLRKLQLGLDLFVKTDLTYFGYWFPFNSCFKIPYYDRVCRQKNIYWKWSKRFRLVGPAMHFFFDASSSHVAWKWSSRSCWEGEVFKNLLFR